MRSSRLPLNFKLVQHTSNYYKHMDGENYNKHEEISELYIVTTVSQSILLRSSYATVKTK